MQIYALNLSLKGRSFQNLRPQQVGKKVIFMQSLDLATSLHVFGYEPCLFCTNINRIQAYLVPYQFQSFHMQSVFIIVLNGFIGHCVFQRLSVLPCGYVISLWQWLRVDVTAPNLRLIASPGGFAVEVSGEPVLLGVAAG